MTIRVPENILGIKPYVPGKPIEALERELGISQSIKLASNENPWALPLWRCRPSETRSAISTVTPTDPVTRSSGIWPSI